MPITITNKADYLLILQLNDGQSVYPPPGESSSAIDDRLLSGNEKFAKLERENIISVATREEGEAEGGGDQHAQEGEAEPAAGSAEATSPGDA
jgi:hypothetical protein